MTLAAPLPACRSPIRSTSSRVRFWRTPPLRPTGGRARTHPACAFVDPFAPSDAPRSPVPAHPSRSAPVCAPAALSRRCRRRCRCSRLFASKRTRCSSEAFDGDVDGGGGRSLEAARLPPSAVLPAHRSPALRKQRRRRRRPIGVHLRHRLLHAFLRRYVIVIIVIDDVAAARAGCPRAPTVRLRWTALPLLDGPPAVAAESAHTRRRRRRPGRQARSVRHAQGGLWPGRSVPGRLPRLAVDGGLPGRDGPHVWDVRGPPPCPGARVGGKEGADDDDDGDGGGGWPGRSRARQGRPDVCRRRPQLARLLDRLPPRCVVRHAGAEAAAFSLFPSPSLAAALSRNPRPPSWRLTDDDDDAPTRDHLVSAGLPPPPLSLSLSLSLSPCALFRKTPKKKPITSRRRS